MGERFRRQIERYADIISIATDTKTKITVFDNTLIASTINDPTKRDDFARSLMRHIADSKINFEPMFSEKYDFFSTMFEHLIKGYTLLTGQYFDVKIEYVPMTADEFQQKIAGFKSRLSNLNAKGAKLDKTITANLEKLEFDK